jgi:hypothetical protein
MKFVKVQQNIECPFCAIKPLHGQKGIYRQCEVCKRRLACLGRDKVLCQDVCLTCLYMYFMDRVEPLHA